MKRLGHMLPVRDISARILSTAHSAISANPECVNQISFLSNLDTNRFSKINAETLISFAKSQQYIFMLAPLRSGCVGQTGLSVLNTAIESGQYENYRSRLNAFLNLSDEKNCIYDELNFDCQSLLIAIYNLAQNEPNTARIALMATEKEIRKLAGFHISQILRFGATGIVPFVFHKGAEDVMLDACETRNFAEFAGHIECVRMKALTALI